MQKLKKNEPRQNLLVLIKQACAPFFPFLPVRAESDGASHSNAIFIFNQVVESAFTSSAWQKTYSNLLTNQTAALPPIDKKPFHLAQKVSIISNRIILLIESAPDLCFFPYKFLFYETIQLIA